MRRPIAIDLFSGCGGMSLGLEAAGFDIAASVEFDAIHALVHHFNFPYGATICQDISTLDTFKLIDKINAKGFYGEIDLIAGGPPCQGFSHIGKRQLDDPRNSLVFEYLRIIRELKPKYFIFENVPGIASGKHKKFLDELIVEFENIGYMVNKPIKILDSSLFGAPQKRKRLFLIGSRNNVKKSYYPQETHINNNFGYQQLFGNDLSILTTVEEAIADLSIHPPFTNNDQGIDSNDLDYTGFRKSFSLLPQGFFSLCHKRKVNNKVYGHLGSNHTDKSINRFKKTEPGKVETTSRFFKLSGKGQCNTLRAGTASDKGAYTAPRPIHYSAARCITVREAARLHTFPDWFQFHNTIWHGFREIGNAVIPLISKAIGDEIIRSIGVNTKNLEIKNMAKVNREILSFNMRQASDYWGIADNVIPKRKRLNKDTV